MALGGRDGTERKQKERTGCVFRRLFGGGLPRLLSYFGEGGREGGGGGGLGRFAAKPAFQLMTVSL